MGNINFRKACERLKLYSQHQPIYRKNFNENYNYMWGWRKTSFPTSGLLETINQSIFECFLPSWWDSGVHPALIASRKKRRKWTTEFQVCLSAHCWSFIAYLSVRIPLQNSAQQSWWKKNWKKKRCTLQIGLWKALVYKQPGHCNLQYEWYLIQNFHCPDLCLYWSLHTEQNIWSSLRRYCISTVSCRL